MRYNLKNSTRAERIVHEILKELKLPFRHRWLVSGREVDFIVDKHAIEINGHEQDGIKNEMLVASGYVPIHLHNQEILINRELVKNIIKNL